MLETPKALSTNESPHTFVGSPQGKSTGKKYNSGGTSENLKDSLAAMDNQQETKNDI